MKCSPWQTNGVVSNYSRGDQFGPDSPGIYLALLGSEAIGQQYQILAAPVLRQGEAHFCVHVLCDSTHNLLLGISSGYGRLSYDCKRGCSGCRCAAPVHAQGLDAELIRIRLQLLRRRGVTLGGQVSSPDDSGCAHREGQWCLSCCTPSRSLRLPLDYDRGASSQSPHGHHEGSSRSTSLTHGHAWVAQG